MAKKMGKFLVLGLIAGATAAGVYHYLSTKEKEAEDFDGYDDFDDFDVFDEDITVEDDAEDKTDETASKSNFVSIDSAKSFVNEAASKAKDVFNSATKFVQEKIEEVTSKEAPAEAEVIVESDATAENAGDEDSEFTMEENYVDEEAEPVAEDVTAVAEENATEEFFDDDEV